MRIMAIDYGDARTGVALSDPTGFLAGQTFLIKSRKEDVVLEELAALAQHNGLQRSHHAGQCLAYGPQVQHEAADQEDNHQSQQDQGAVCQDFF